MSATDDALAAGTGPDIATRVHGARSSFFWGMRLLPEERRQAIYAVYAFCRAVDDIADGDAPAAEKRRQLAAWRRAVHALYDEGRADGPILRALAPAVRRFELPRAELLAVLDGMESDATTALVGPSDAELRLYCRRVAGAVGVLSLSIFADGDPGLDAAQRLDLAETLGEGLQLTNILRDLRDDAARGRLYLPDEGLVAAGIATRDPAAVVDHPALAAVCRPLAAQARAHLARARTLLQPAEARTRRPCRLMLEAYAAQLRRIEAAGYPPPARRVHLSKPAKLWIAVRYSLL